MGHGGHLLVQVSSRVSNDNGSHNVTNIPWNGSCRWFLHWFFFIRGQVATILPKPHIYFSFKTGYKFGFSFLNEKRGQTVLDHNPVCFIPSVASKGFVAPLTVDASRAFIMDTSVITNVWSFRAFSFCWNLPKSGQPPVSNAEVKNLCSQMGSPHSVLLFLVGFD